MLPLSGASKVVAEVRGLLLDSCKRQNRLATSLSGQVLSSLYVNRWSCVKYWEVNASVYCNIYIYIW